MGVNALCLAVCRCASEGWLIDALRVWDSSAAVGLSGVGLAGRTGSKLECAGVLPSQSHRARGARRSVGPAAFSKRLAQLRCVFVFFWGGALRGPVGSARACGVRTWCCARVRLHARRRPSARPLMGECFGHNNLRVGLAMGGGEAARAPLKAGCGPGTGLTLWLLTALAILKGWCWINHGNLEGLSAEPTRGFRLVCLSADTALLGWIALCCLDPAAFYAQGRVCA